jgi:hypothetical protein
MAVFQHRCLICSVLLDLIEKGLVPSCQTILSLLRTPWLAKLARKMDMAEKWIGRLPIQQRMLDTNAGEQQS